VRDSNSKYKYIRIISILRCKLLRYPQNYPILSVRAVEFAEQRKKPPTVI
jgi:hypothetical protein